LHDVCTFYVCKHCGHYIDLVDLKVGKVKEGNMAYELLWPLGTLANFYGISWQLVGAVHRKENGAEYNWQEYCFFNPREGFLYLQEYTGNWITLRETIEFPQNSINTTTIEDKKGNQYQLFLRYKTLCLNAIGEFPYDIKDTNNKLVKEYIEPPMMFLRKDYAKETIWFKGEHISRKEVFKALGDPSYAVPKVGKGSIQPQKLGLDHKTFAIYAGIAIILMVLFTIVFESSVTPKRVYGNSYFFNVMDSVQKPQISESFILEEGIDNVELNFEHDLDQNWTELEVTLMSDGQEEEYTLTEELYWYSGYDDEGSWTDGSKHYRSVVSGIPAGKYHLQVVPYLSTAAKNVTVHLDIYRGVPVRSNLYWLIGLIVILVYIQYLRVVNFERNRWSNSNYSTYDHRTWYERNLGGDDE
jgi:hypothetical protein